jgi:hypothetical protein
MKITKILLNAIPIILMIALIPLVKNDYLLTAIYAAIIVLSLIIHYEKKDYIFLIIGFVIMLISEFFFIKTGVETFNRNSLFGIMPLWLPFLWAYSFVAIKRVINILQ